MSVADILKNKGRTVFTIRPEHSVADAAHLMTAKRVGVAVVCDTKGHIVGIISERDIVGGLTKYGKAVVDMPVRNIMTTPVITCHPEEQIKNVLKVMTDRRIRHLPVVDGDELLGIVSIGDAVNFRLKETQMEVGVLRDFAVIR